MADHLNVMGTVETYCLNERAFVHCLRNCAYCPSYVGNDLGRSFRGYISDQGNEWLYDEIKYHSRCAYQNAKLDIKKVIFNPPATIVFWTDGTKTVVKAHDEPFDQEKGIAMALVKKMQLAKRFRVIVQEPKVKKPKKRKTWRDVAAQKTPHLIEPYYLGGVRGCPGDYFRFAPSVGIDCRGGDEDLCRECWDQEVSI